LQKLQSHLQPFILHCNKTVTISRTPASQPASGDHEMRMFVIAASALLAVATQALVVGAVVTTI
jgi:hypothetical protein